MKVLVSSLSRDFGGVESLFLNLIKCRQENGFHMDFVCFDTTAARESEFISLGASVYHTGRFSQNLKKCIGTFWKLFRSKEYDIYHVNLTRYRFPLDVVMAKMCGISVVLHCHSTQIYDIGSRKVRAIRNLEQIFFKWVTLACGDLNLACSKSAGRYLFGGNPYQVLYNGIDIERFRFSECGRKKVRASLGLSGKKVIGHIGRFSHEKNHSFLLLILKKLLERDKNYRLLCVGDGDLFEQKLQLAVDMGVSNAVIFAGQRTDTPELLSAMDIFLFPSIHEALPITLIEAQANGLPCVISDCVTDEIDVLEQICRLSLSNNSIDDWADKVESLCGQRTGANTQVEFSAFEIKNTAGQLNDIYKHVLDK